MLGIGRGLNASGTEALPGEPAPREKTGSVRPGRTVASSGGEVHSG